LFSYFPSAGTPIRRVLNFAAGESGFVDSLASALDARDRYTAGHSERVSATACAVAQAMASSGEEVEQHWQDRD